MSLEHFIEIIESKIKIGLEKEEIERYYYKLLSESLKEKNFANFKKIIDHSIKLNIFLDIKKIPNRFDIISNLITKCIQTAIRGLNYQTFLGEQIEILKFCYKFNIFEKETYLKKDLNLIEEIRRENIIISNLKDIFGSASNSLLYYLYHVMPRALYRFFINSIDFNYFSMMDNTEQDFSFVIEYFNNYSSYRLFIKKIGKVSNFLAKFDKIYEEYKQNSLINNEKISFITFKYLRKTLLVSPENIIKNKKNIIDSNNYHFYSLAMVQLGGIGPEGHGFIYSTPRGELIEICSDAKETDAIIVKYKQFKKQQFLRKLAKQFSNLAINQDIKNKIIDFLSGVLNNEDMIDYFKKEPILDRIISYLKEDRSFNQRNKSDLHNLIKLISVELTLILRTVKMEDQFKTRMKLVHEDKLKSEEVAKYTCLEEKSHYDVLRERIFFQNIMARFRKILIRKNP